MSLTSYRAAPPRVTMWGCAGQPGSVFVCPFRRCRSGRRAAPPRVTMWAALGSPEAFLCVHSGGAGWTAGCSCSPRICGAPRHQKAREGPLGWAIAPGTCVNGLPAVAPASMPGDVLLFQRLSGSTIGAVRFHGRVRDGIGWVTDAMVTKQ